MSEQQPDNDNDKPVTAEQVAAMIAAATKEPRHPMTILAELNDALTVNGRMFAASQDRIQRDEAHILHLEAQLEAIDNLLKGAEPDGGPNALGQSPMLDSLREVLGELATCRTAIQVALKEMRTIRGILNPTPIGLINAITILETHE